VQQRNNSFNISRWCIERPYWVVAFYASVVLLTVLAVIFYVPRRMMPYVESPMLGIVSMMPGLSAEEMETYISKPIEERMVAVNKARFIRSTSQEGFSIVSLEFPYGTDMKKALVEVQALMNVVQSDLPVTGANLKPSWVVLIDPLNIPVLTLTLTGDSRWDPVRLRQLADNEIINQLKTIEGVYAASPYGGRKRQLQIVIDRTRLASYGLSISDVRKSLDEFNVAKPAGFLTSGPNETIVRLNNLAMNASEAATVPIKALPGGRFVHLSNVAEVSDTYSERRSAYHFAHGKQIDEAVGINIVQSPEGSSPHVVAAATKMARELERQFPGIKLEPSYNNAQFVEILFHNMWEELALAVFLTGLAIFLFLNNWRTSVVAMLTIPISMVLAIGGLVLMGMSLNSSTLIGLILSTGRDTDDTVVDLHSIEKHLAMGKSPADAAVDGITEVRLAVLASTLMTILALLPLLFCGGIVQQMFVGLVWPIILGNVCSFFVELTLTPIIAAKFLRLPDPNSVRPWIYRCVIDPLQNRIAALEEQYGRLVGWTLNNRFLVMGTASIFMIAGFGFYNFIGSEMMPLADVAQAYGVLETKPGTSFARTEQIAAGVEKLLLKHPEVEMISTELGTESGPAYASTRAVYFTGYSMNQPNSAAMMITLSDKDTRKRTVWQIIDQVQKEALAIYGDDIRRLQIKEMGSDVMASSQAPISLLVYGKDLNMLDKLGQKVAQLSAKVPGLVNVATDWTMGLPCKEVKIDAERALEFGVTPSMVAEQLYYGLGGGFTNEYYRQPNIRQNSILIRYDQLQRRDGVSDLENAYITNEQGQSIPLKAIATISDRMSPTLITHDGLRRVITVNGFYRKEGMPSMDLAMTAIQKSLSDINWPPGYGLEVRGDMTQMSDSFRRLAWGLLICVILIYMMLVAQFRGWVRPLQMVLTLPLQLTGVFFGLFVMNQAFSSVSIMTLILLTGMQVTTAILMVDAINEERAAGVPEKDAIKRGCLSRIRPILMTNIASILVMVPVSVFPQTGMDAYAPLGTVILWGLVAGTLMTLFVLPAMHSLIEDVSAALRSFLQNLARTIIGLSNRRVT
jgi:hydrophobic/amphiphilic exporter-1 (mainly G- bacteria), HAE1 family